MVEFVINCSPILFKRNLHELIDQTDDITYIIGDLTLSGNKRLRIEKMDDVYRVHYARASLSAGMGTTDSFLYANRFEFRIREDGEKVIIGGRIELKTSVRVFFLVWFAFSIILFVIRPHVDGILFLAYSAIVFFVWHLFTRVSFRRQLRILFERVAELTLNK